MPTHRGAFAALALVFAAGSLAGTATLAQGDACERDPKKVSLKIKVKDDRPTKVVKGLFGWENADTINVCRGDTIEWKIQHSKEYEIRFPGETPVDGKALKSNDGTVETRVRDDAERSKQYKYDIAIIDGGVLDPIIILD